jgi:amino acid adenylation domain-containing protein
MTLLSGREVVDAYPLTSGQQGILIESLAASGPPRYLQHHALELTGPADPGVLRVGLAGLAAEHDVLRTGFVWDVTDEPLQVVRAQAEIPLTVTDADGSTDEAVGAGIARLLEEERRTPFDLSTPPLLRVRALRVTGSSWRLVTTHHHLILDAWSMPLLFGRLADILAARLRGDRISVRPAHGFREFVRWQQAARQLGRDEAYFASLLDGVTGPTRPGGAPRVLPRFLSSGSSAPGPLPGTSPAPSVTALRRVRPQDHPDRAARRGGLRPATVAHAAWALLLARWSGTSDVVFGTTVSGRPADLPHVTERIGMFVNTAVLRIKVPDAPLGEWLEAVQRSLDEARQHEHAPLGAAQRVAALPPDHPLLSSVLAFQNALPRDSGTVSGAVTLRVIDHAERTGLPVSLSIALPDDGVWVRLSHDPSWVGPAEARWLAETLARLTADLAVLPWYTPLAGIPVVTASVPRPRAGDAFDGMRSVVLSRLAQQVRCIADAGAYCGVTPRALHAAVAETARRLGAATPDITGRAVMVHAPSGAALVTGILAAVSCGAMPVAVDPYLPADELPGQLGAGPVLHSPGASLRASSDVPTVEICVPRPDPAPEEPASRGLVPPEAGPARAVAAAGRVPAGGLARGQDQPRLDGLASGTQLAREGLRLGPGDRVLAVLAADDVLTPTVVLAALSAGSHLELLEPGSEPPPDRATVLIAPHPLVAELLRQTVPGARVVVAGDPPPPWLISQILQCGRVPWRLWASGRTGGADACARLTGPDDARLLGDVPGSRLADEPSGPLAPGRSGELEIVLPGGACRTGIRVRQRDEAGPGGADQAGQAARWEQLGRSADDELLVTEQVLASDESIRAAVVTGCSGDDLHAWLVCAGADVTSVARLAQARVAPLPGRCRPAGYTVLRTLPVAPSGAVNRAALAVALAPPRRAAPDAAPVAARLAALPPETRDGFVARLRSAASRDGGRGQDYPDMPGGPHQAALGAQGGPVRDGPFWEAVLDGLTAMSWPLPPAGPAAAAAALRGAAHDGTGDPVELPVSAPAEAWIAAAVTALAMLAGREDVVIGVITRPDRPTRARFRGLLAPAIPLRVTVRPGQPFVVTRAAVATSLRAGRSRGVPWADLAALPGGPPTVSLAVHRRAGRPPVAGHTSIALDVAPAARRPATRVIAICAPERAHPRDGQRLRDLTVAILRSGLGGEDRPLHAADLVESAAYQELMAAADGGPPGPATAAAVPGVIRARAADRPGATAIEAPDATLSYAELADHAGRFAQRLRVAGIGEGDLVAVCLPRQSFLVWAMLGIMSAGAAYVPLSPGDPDDRLRRLLAGCRASAVVTTAELAARFPGETVLSVDGPSEADPAAASPPGPGLPHSRALAYVLYTSGSTGEPKGVMVEHHSVVSFSRHIAQAYQLGPGTKLLAFAPPSFDVSVFELWAGLAAGATIVLAGEQERLSADALQGLMERHGVTVAELPPSLMPLLEPSRMPDLRLVSVGGEAPAGTLVDGWTTDSRDFWNGYGPTEATVAVTLMRCRPPSGGRVPPIGRPMPGHRAYVLAEDLRPVPAGVTGELYLSGPGLARGYLGQPGATAARFVPDPHGEPGRRMYRTGDLARWTADGVLEFAGRADGQLKIRGFRVEPAEVEAAMASDPGVSQAAVAPWDAADGTRHLVAYVVPSDPAEPPSLPGLRESVGRLLAPYMLPTRLVVLDRIPLTVTGKLDRERLPGPASHEGPLASDCTWSETEQVLARELIGPLIGRPDVGREDGFFHLGGNSLQVMQVTARVAERFGVQISLPDFFRDPTIARLAALIESARAPGAAPGARGPAGQAGAGQATGQGASYQMTAGASVPLSYPQAALHAACLATGDRAAYHGPIALRVHGPLGLDALRASFRWLMARHPALRVTFEDRPGGPVQFVHAVAEPPFEVREAEAGEPAGREAALQRAIAQEAARPFDLRSDLPLRVLVHRLDPGDQVVQWTFHHLAIDGWSAGVVARELSSAYTAFAAGTQPAAPALTGDYGDFVCWHRSYVEGPDYRRDLDWWGGYLTGAGAAPGLGGAAPDHRPEFRHGWRNLELPPPTAVALRVLLRSQGITLYMACLAAEAILLSAETGAEDVVVVTPYSLRLRPEWEKLVGWFVNRVIVRLRVGPAWSFRELTASVRDTCAAVFGHGRMPFELLRGELGLGDGALPAQLSVQNAPTAGVNFRDADITEATDGSGRDFAPLLEVYSPLGAPFQLSVMLRERYDGRIAGGLEYDAARVSPDTADRWHAAFLGILGAAAAHPETTVGRLAGLTRDPAGMGAAAYGPD